MDKPWWQSKTLWFNALSLAVVVITAAVDTDLVKNNPALVLAFMAVVNILNAVLRFLTTEGIKVLVLLAVLLAPLASMAEEVAVLVNDSAPGTYLLTVNADKSVTVNPIKVVRPGLPSPPPTNPPTNPPNSPSPFELEVERITKEVLSKGGTATTGAALSSVYSLVADEVAAGRISPANALPAIKAATDLVLSKQADGAAWATWRTSIGDALTILNQQGQLGTKDQVFAALRQIANGMNRATGFSSRPSDIASLKAPANGILDGVNLAQLMELIKLIVELLKLFGVGK